MLYLNSLNGQEIRLELFELCPLRSCLGGGSGDYEFKTPLSPNPIASDGVSKYFILPLFG
jgi:hypothetical protein